MAVPYIMPSGKPALQDGNIVMAMSEEDFEDCCCGSAPCDVCQEDQASTLT